MNLNFNPLPPDYFAYLVSFVAPYKFQDFFCSYEKNEIRIFEGIYRGTELNL